MTKLLGCGLILSAATLLLRQKFCERSALLHTVRELRNALEQIATAIRWQQMPLTQAIRRQSGGKYTGYLFVAMIEHMDSEIPLQTLWTECFQSLDEPISGILCAVQLQGDREHLMCQLGRAAHDLEHYEKNLRVTEQDRRKLLCAATLSGASVLMILLL